LADSIISRGNGASVILIFRLPEPSLLLLFRKFSLIL